MSELSQHEIDALNKLVREIDGGIWVDEHGTTWRMGETIPITVTQPGDYSYYLLHDKVTSTPVIHKTGCYICEDPEFAQMGVSLCRRCPACGGHVAADDTVCDDCGLDEWYFWMAEREKEVASCFSTGTPDYNDKVPTEEQLQAAMRAFKDREENDD